MSSNDKTRQKLMESMRKTKAGSATEGDAAAQAEAKPAKVATKKNSPSTRQTTPKTNKLTQTDPYQSQRRRVWPD